MRSSIMTFLKMKSSAGIMKYETYVSISKKTNNEVSRLKITSHLLNEYQIKYEQITLRCKSERNQVKNIRTKLNMFKENEFKFTKKNYRTRRI